MLIEHGTDVAGKGIQPHETFERRALHSILGTYGDTNLPKSLFVSLFSRSGATAVSYSFLSVDISFDWIYIDRKYKSDCLMRLSDVTVR